MFSNTTREIVNGPRFCKAGPKVRTPSVGLRRAKRGLLGCLWGPSFSFPAWLRSMRKKTSPFGASPRPLRAPSGQSGLRGSVPDQTLTCWNEAKPSSLDFKPLSWVFPRQVVLASCWETLGVDLKTHRDSRECSRGCTQGQHLALAIDLPRRRQKCNILGRAKRFSWSGLCLDSFLFSPSKFCMITPLVAHDLVEGKATTSPWWRKSCVVPFGGRRPALHVPSRLPNLQTPQGRGCIKVG